eukprot:GHVT01081754.1.p3 GENE.GHVT01081754.1~~GHVT01081754.1.p3  ORF type:complete len:178 (+),score=42.50 GHVT01081754.1:576-1109(+)
MLFPVTEAHKKFEKDQEVRIEAEGQTVPKDLWFSKQSVANACGTVGLMHAFANMGADAPYESEGFFGRFFAKSAKLSPEERAKALEEDTEIEKAHHDAEQQGQSRVPPPEEEIDVHFVTLVPFDGCLFELDGRKKFPINHGPTTKATFLKDAAKIARSNFIDVNPSDIRFQMIAITK